MLGLSGGSALHNVLLVIHVLSVIVWLGAGVGATYFGSRLTAEGGEIAVKWLRLSETSGSRLYGPASGLTLLSGIGLVLTTDAYSFGSIFVILGMTVWIVLAIANGAYAGRQEKKLLKATEESDEPTRRETTGALNRFLVVEYILLVTVVIAMIYRWGA
jgi:uncharacterized membrane protein